jgi:hypothetical protein
MKALCDNCFIKAQRYAKILECGFRISEYCDTIMKISECGLRIAECFATILNNNFMQFNKMVIQMVKIVICCN